MKYTKVENEPNYIRDNNSRGILNTDNKGLVAYRLQKENRFKQQDQVERLANDVIKLKDDISDIKNLLVSLLDK